MVAQRTVPELMGTFAFAWLVSMTRLTEPLTRPSSETCNSSSRPLALRNMPPRIEGLGPVEMKRDRTALFMLRPSEKEAAQKFVSAETPAVTVPAQSATG